MRAGFGDIPEISSWSSEPIEMRVQEMVIGARGDLVLKVFGPDLAELNRIVRQGADVVRRLPGAPHVSSLRNEGMKYLTICLDRLAAGRSGLNAPDVRKTLRAWVDGAPA